MAKGFYIILLTLILATSIASAASDTAYIVKNSQGIDNFLINEMNDNNLNVDIIFESQIASTNLNNYDLLIIGNQKLDAPKNIPVEEHQTLIINSYNFYNIFSDPQLGWSKNKGSVGSPTPLQITDITTTIGETIIGSFRAYTVTSPSVKAYYLSGEKPINIKRVISKSGSSEDVLIATMDIGTTFLNNKTTEERNLFFGITEARFWTQETKKLFSDSIFWLLNGADFDQDGYLSSDDCDDTDPEINPSANEIPYDEIDQDCSGSDLIDVDNDGFISDILLQGNDCDDENPLINPNATELHDSVDQNCINDGPTFHNGVIPNITINEDTQHALDLNEYFTDVDSVLDFFVFGNNFINITINNGVALISPLLDWYGSETIAFAAEDEEFSIESNEITITVLDAGEAPVLQDLTCESNINEDEENSCDIEAFDFENNNLTFSTTHETNLQCEFSENTLTYVSAPDYYGIASCEITVTDEHGFDVKNFEVNISPINDAPRFDSYTPIENIVNIPENQDKTFEIEVSDVEDDNFTITWTLDNEQNETLSEESIYTLNKPIGVYNLQAEISDFEKQNIQSWNVIVGDTSEFTCSQVSGNVCNKEQVCPIEGDLIDVKNSNSCCSIACEPKPPKFSDIEECKELSRDLEIEFKKPLTTELYELEENVKVELKIENKFEKDQDFDIEIHLYDITDDKSVAETQGSSEIDQDKTRTSRFNLEIPESLELDNQHVVFVKAEDDVCAQEFLEINIEKPDEKIVISEFEMQSKAVCGDLIKASIKVKNLGSNSQEIRVILENDDLGFLESTESFHLEDYNEDNDEKTKQFLISIPTDAEPGKYEIIVEAISKDVAITKSKTLTIESCGDEQLSEVIKQKITPPQEITLSLNSNVERLNEKTTSQEKEDMDESDKTTLITMLLVFTLNVALVGGLILLLGKK